MFLCVTIGYIRVIIEIKRQELFFWKPEGEMELKNNRFVTYGIDTLLLLVLSTAFCSLGGVLGSVIGILISAVLATVYCREHYSLSIFSTLLSLAVITFFYGPLQMLYLAVPLVLVALSLTLGTKLKIGFLPLVTICTILFLSEFLVGLKIVEMTQSGVTFSSMVLDTGREFQTLFIDQLPDAALQEQMKDIVESSLHTFIMLAPAVFTVICAVLSLFQILVYKRIQQKRKVDMSFLTPFDSLQADRAGSIIFLLVILLANALPEGLFRDAMVNVSVISGFMLMVCGVSFFDFKLNQVGMRKFVRRFILVVLAMSSTMLMMAPLFLLVGGGLLDSFFDFRHKRNEENQK